LGVKEPASISEAERGLIQRVIAFQIRAVIPNPLFALRDPRYPASG